MLPMQRWRNQDEEPAYRLYRFANLGGQERNGQRFRGDGHDNGANEDESSDGGATGGGDTDRDESGDGDEDSD